MARGPQDRPATAPVERARLARIVLLPLLAGLLCHCVAQVLPADRVWTNALQALLLTAPRWLVLLWPLGALGLVLRRRQVVVPLGLTVAGLALAGLPALGTVPAEGPGRLLVSANVQAYADDHLALDAALAALHADVVLTVELRAQQVAGMDRVADNYDRPLSRTSHGTAVFCRPELACQAEITREFGSDDSHMPLALVRFDGVCLLGVHGPPPVPLNATGLAPYMARVAGAITDGRMGRDWGPCRTGDPVIVAGDLNAVPGSGPHRLLRSRGLRDPLQIQGIWAGTWPAGGGWPDLPVLRLDHLLPGAVAVEQVRTLRLPDSDHKALRARVRTDVMLDAAEEDPS